MHPVRTMAARTITAPTIAVGCLFGLFLGGCGSSEPAAADPANPGPQEIVQQFLSAVKAGEDGKAEKLFTKKAMQELKKAEMVVAPPGSETASFDVLETEDVEGGAHVLSTWTDGTGEHQHTDEIIWVLREEPEGWRIVGMITKPFPDLPPVVSDFEDPQDMMQQFQQVAAEAQRRTALEQQRLASPPETPGTSVQK